MWRLALLVTFLTNYAADGAEDLNLPLYRDSGDIGVSQCTMQVIAGLSVMTCPAFGHDTKHDLHECMHTHTHT